MFDFLSQKPKATADRVAEELFNVLIESKESEAEWVEEFRNHEIDPHQGLSELLYLRAVAVDIAVVTALQAGLGRDEVLSGYRGRIGNLLEERYSKEDFQARKVAYLETFGRSMLEGPGKVSEGKNNPYQDIAFKFAEFCGSKDIAVVIMGGEFASYLNNTHEFLKSIKIVESGLGGTQ